MKEIFMPTPVELAFEPVNLCNAKCFCCPYTFLEQDKKYRGVKMSTDQITFLIKDFVAQIDKFSIPRSKCAVQPWRYSDPLVCKNLDLIFELCQENNLKINLTTNAVSFTEDKCKLIMNYLKYIDNIYVSIIGFNKKEIKEFMDIDWDVTQSRLKMIKNKFPKISKKMIIGVKHKNQNPDSLDHLNIILQIKNLTLGKVKKKTNWLENRIEYNKLAKDDYNFDPSHKQFVQGCSMVYGKILRRLEIMVDGTAVLCCDDATKQTNFGNVFDIGVSGVWNSLVKYHKLIYNNKFTKEKINMICNSCSRARFNWNTELDDQIIKVNNTILKS